MSSKDDYQGALEVANVVKGSRANDHLVGTLTNDKLSGGKGDDSIYIAGGDIGKGGKGNDLVDASYATIGTETFLVGGRGNDTLVGGEANDTFRAINGNNTVTTGDGEDTILLTYKQEKMEARAGNEAPDGQIQDAYTTVTDFDVAKDTLNFSGMKAKHASKLDFVDVPDLNGKSGIMITDENGNKIAFLEGLTPADVENLNINYGRFDTAAQKAAVLNSEAAGDSSDASAGRVAPVPEVVRTDGTNDDERIVGDSRDELIFGEGGNDTIKGKGGNDTLHGGGGDDNLKGGKGDDRLNGGNGNDKLSGGKGDDKLSAGLGDDTLSGGEGNDTLTGGDGSDVFVFNSRSTGNNLLRDFEFGIDEISLVGVTGESISMRGSDAIVELDNDGFVRICDMDITDVADLFGL